MVVKNQLWNDARVKKEALALFRAGYRVTVVAKPEAGRPPEETWRGIRIRRPPKHSRTLRELRERIVRASAEEDESLRARLIRAVRRNRLRQALTDVKRSVPWELRLLGTALSERADIYHAHDLDALLVGYLAARALGARLVYDAHELWLESSRYMISTSPPDRLRYRLTERLLLPGADAVIAVTPSRARAMRAMYPHSIRRMAVVENSTPRMPNLPAPRDLRGRLGIPEGAFVALYQGVICPERGLEQLLEAASMLRGKGAYVAVVGHDAWQGTLPRMAREMGVDDLVRFHPPVPSEELAALTVAADAGLILFRNTCLNHYYSLPNKLYEYMMAGIPIIASDFPEMGRIIDGVGCGVLVDPESPGEIARAIGGLAEMGRAHRGAMGRRGRTAALDRHNWETQRDRLLELYRSLEET
jgi:glycosyltransferase involved in cell wall biosynthesis